MANRKVGGQAELIEDLRGEFEQHLRQLAEKRGMGRRNAQRMSFRALVLGLPVRPTAFVVDAYAHALQQRDNTTRDRILANIYAARTELAELEKLGMGHQYFFHLGLGNTAGAIFSTIEQVCKANGLMAWEWMANYRLFKSYAVNNLDFNKETGRYDGDDIPENHSR